MDTKERIESELEVKLYIQNLKCALDHGAQINFQVHRFVDEMRDVYIKIRVELLGVYGGTTTFVMSFHFAERKFEPEIFPYRKM